jgi:hypothetical protein
MAPRAIALRLGLILMGSSTAGFEGVSRVFVTITSCPHVNRHGKPLMLLA